MAPTPPTSSLRYDIVALIAVALFGLGFGLQKSPIQVAGTNAEVTGTTPPTGMSASDTLLVLPDLGDDRPQAATFNDVDMALGWYNTVAQEMGGFAHTQLRALDREDLTHRRLVIMTGTAARRATTEQISMLGDWVADGGILLVEQPSPAWDNLLQLTVLPDKIATTRHITAADGAPLRGPLREALLDAPLLTTMRPFHLPPRGPEETPFDVILEVDGSAALVHIPRDKGHIYAASFDIGRAVMTLQQGRPGSDFTPLVTADARSGDELARPWMLTASPKMLDARTPFADLIERNTLQTISLHVPIPRLWYFPDQFAGVYIVTHNEDAVGQRITALTDWEAERGRTSTTFLTTDSLSSESIGQMLKQGHDLQLQWSRPTEDGRGLRRVGIGAWRPVLWELSLDEQKRTVENHLVQSSVTMTRVSDQALDGDWSSTFQKLAAVQVVADSSYGPGTAKQSGYLFGTGMLFYPLDRAGMLIPVAEIPFVLTDDFGFDPKEHRRLLIGSESGYHQVLVVCFNAGSMAHHPSVDAVRTWQKAVQTARKHNHWVATLKDYLLFEEARRSSTVVSEFYPAERRLEMKVTIQKPRLPGVGEPGTANERIIPSLAIPQTFEGLTVESARIDGATITLKNLGRSADGFFHTLSVPPGEHVVQIIYQGRAGDE